MRPDQKRSTKLLETIFPFVLFGFLFKNIKPCSDIGKLGKPKLSFSPLLMNTQILQDPHPPHTVQDIKTKQHFVLLRNCYGSKQQSELTPGTRNSEKLWANQTLNLALPTCRMETTIITYLRTLLRGRALCKASLVSSSGHSSCLLLTL